MEQALAEVVALQTSMEMAAQVDKDQGLVLGQEEMAQVLVVDKAQVVDLLT